MFHLQVSWASLSWGPELIVSHIDLLFPNSIMFVCILKIKNTLRSLKFTHMKSLEMGKWKHQGGRTNNIVFLECILWLRLMIGLFRVFQCALHVCSLDTFLIPQYSGFLWTGSVWDTGVFFFKLFLSNGLLVICFVENSASWSWGLTILRRLQMLCYLGFLLT